MIIGHQNKQCRVFYIEFDVHIFSQRVYKYVANIRHYVTMIQERYFSVNTGHFSHDIEITAVQVSKSKYNFVELRLYSSS